MVYKGFRAIVGMAASITVLAACAPQHESAVKQLLNDPDSARFSDVVQGAAPGDVCGYVNAKNKMGGYAGKTPFYYRAHGVTEIVPVLRDDDFHAFFMNMTASDSDTRYAALAKSCHATRAWKHICGFDHPGGAHRLCGPLLQTGNTSSLYLALENEFRR